MSTNLKYGDYLEFVNNITNTSRKSPSWTQEDSFLYLGGYLAAFQFRYPTASYIPYDGGAWWFPYLNRWWTRPGKPVIPQAEICREEMGRLNFIIREVLTEAVLRGELCQLTVKRGRSLIDMVYRSGLGHLVPLITSQ